MDNTDFYLDSEEIEELEGYSEIEEEIDALVEVINGNIYENEGCVMINNFVKIRDIIDSYELIKSSVSGIGVKVDYHVNEPMVNMGYISIVGKNIKFNNPKVIEEVAALADNFEVYPRTDGTVKINFTFQNVTVEVGKEEGFDD